MRREDVRQWTGESDALSDQGIVEIDEARMKRELQDRVKDTQTLLSYHPAQARQMLRKLLEEPVMCEASEENGRKGCDQAFK